MLIPNPTFPILSPTHLTQLTTLKALYKGIVVVSSLTSLGCKTMEKEILDVKL